MSCCGNKNDVPAATRNSVRALKVYGQNDTVVPVRKQDFRPIPKNNVGSYSKVTKQEDYARQATTGSKSNLFADLSTLKFDLDEEPGVANTFDIPTFDYTNILTHNIYFNKNSKSIINVNDGNRSVFRTANNQPIVK